MTDTVEEIIETGIALFIIVMGLISLVNFMRVTMNPIVTPTQDKTVISSVGTSRQTEVVYTGEEIYGMIAQADVMTPYPNAVKFGDSPIILLDSTFHASKQGEMIKIFRTEEYKYEEYKDKYVDEIKFIHKGISGEATDYWHITFKD